MIAKRKSMIIILLVIALVLIAVIQFPTYRYSLPHFLINDAVICFYQINPHQFRIDVGIPEDRYCFSSSCTNIYDETGNMNVDMQSMIIQLHTRFIFGNVIGSSGRVCTADCAGSISLKFETNQLKDGVYAIKLGNLKIGDLIVPTSHLTTCFSTSATAIPYQSPTPPIPTPTRDQSLYPPPSTPTPWIYP